MMAAILDSVRILHKGKKWPADFEGFFEQNLPEASKFLDQSTNISDGGMQPDGDTRVYFKLVANDGAVEKLISILEKLEADKSIDILIYYSSIYNERWMINLFSETSTPIRLD